MAFVLDEKGNYLPVLGETSGSGGTSDHAQLTNLDYTNSGHTGFMSSANYLQDGTVVTVKADGTGDFTTLEGALEYLEPKWSDGEIIIDISAGTYQTAGSISLDNYKIKRIIIKGAGKTSTFIYTPFADTQTAGFFQFEVINGTNVIFKDIKLGTEIISIPEAYNHKIIQVRDNAMVNFDNVAFNGTARLVQVDANAVCYIMSDCDFSNAVSGILCSRGEIRMQHGLTFTCSNITTVIHIQSGGVVKFWSATFANTNVTNVCNHNPQTEYVTADGLCFGSFTTT